MLTIRLNQNGMLCALQTNRVITLLRATDDAYKEIMHLIPAAQPGDVMFKDGAAAVLNQRTDRSAPPAAALCLTPHLDSGTTEELKDTRVICLYDGDTAHAIDSGVTLFKWPRG